MKVSAMNSDQYKISIEAHPLQALYSKYNEADDETQNQSVRPLGKIRQKGRPSSDYHTPRATKTTWTREKTLNGKREMKLDSRLYSGRMKCQSDQNISSSNTRDKEVNILPLLRRSKTQAFEEKFKIAASRQCAAESPSPQLRPNKSYDKKVVHLPLFKINLRTYVEEEEVSRTVAKTRESLRKLMDLNKAKMRNANVITANIKNYEFNAPRSNTTLTREHTSESSRTLVSLPFHAKPALRSSRDSSRERDLKGRHYSRSNTFIKFGASEISNDEPRYRTRSGKETPDRVNTFKRHISDFIGPEDEPDSSMVSLAIRPDTSLTLGTTMCQIDRVIKTPTSDELRELAEAFKSSEPSTGWPNPEDIHSVVARNQSRTTKSRTPFSRPTTVLNNVPEVDDETVEYKQKYSCALPHEHGHKHSPVLRYTSKQSTYKLEPIIVPSHTCTECPMCNGSQRDVETPCPPNTPNTGHFTYEPNIPNSNRYMYDPSTPPARRNMYESGAPHVSRYIYEPDLPQRSRTMFETGASHESLHTQETDLHQRSRFINEADTYHKNQFMYGIENRTAIMQGHKMNSVHGKPEVLRVSRINMNGYTSPEDDSAKISFMKTF